MTCIYRKNFWESILLNGDFQKFDDKYSKKELKRGDKVYGSDHSVEEAMYNKIETIYVATIDGAKYPHIVVPVNESKAFRNGEKFDTMKYAYVVKVTQKKRVSLTMAELCEKLGKISGFTKLNKVI